MMKLLNALFPVLFLEVDARKDADRGDTDKENNEGWHVVGIHLTDP